MGPTRLFRPWAFPGKNTGVGCHFLLHASLLLLLSGSVVSDSLPPHGLQHARLPCPSLSPGVPHYKILKINCAQSSSFNFFIYAFNSVVCFQLLSSKSKIFIRHCAIRPIAVLFNKIFCVDKNVLYLCYPLW